jgi:hypothetical protein
MSHVADGLIGTTTHHNPYSQPPPMYGTPQYIQPYGGPSYYPPPPYQQPYPVAPPPPMSGPSPDTHDVIGFSTKFRFPFYLNI